MIVVNYNINADSDSDYYEFDAFARSIQGQTAGLQRNIPMEISLLDCAAAVANTFIEVEAKPLIRALDVFTYIVSAHRDGAHVAAATIRQSTAHDIFDPRVMEQNYYNVSIRCLLGDLHGIARFIEGRLHKVHMATIEWWFQSAKRTTQHHMLMQEPPVTRDEGYPWIKGGLDAYFDRFLASEASALFLSGPPGTGKTSFLRWLLWQKKRHAMVTYDEELLGSDELFIALLASQADTLIIEDADTMLAPRKTSGNKLMGRL